LNGVVAQLTQFVNESKNLPALGRRREHKIRCIGVANLTGGSVFASSVIVGSSAGGTGSLNLSGSGTLSASSFSVVSGGTFTASGGTLSANAISVAPGGVIDFARASDVTYPGIISGAGTIN
jgi:hypothetical protein